MIKQFKKAGIFIMILMTILTGCSESETTAPVREVEDNSIVIGNMGDRNNTDVVLVMDKSGSMVTADPNRFAIEGAKLFVDMEKLSGVSIALVEFSNDLMSTGLIEMRQKDDKEYLKTILDGVEYVSTAHTDTGAGMLEAISVLDQSDSTNDKAIILFTDGRTDIDAGTPGRTTEDSIHDTDYAVQMAVEKGYTIYCIGLNSDGRVDEAALRKMALATNGKYHIATSVDELREFFHSIFMDIDETKEEKIDEYMADGNYHDSVFTIDNASVAEVNILILSSRQIEDIILSDNNGENVDLKNDPNVIYSNSAAYSLIKLINPAVGEWKISVKGVTDDQIRIGMIYNFNLNLMIEADKTSVIRGDSVNVKAYLASDGEIFTDREFYQSITATLFVKNNSTGQKTPVNLLLNPEGSVFEGDFMLPEAVTYDAYVHIEGNGLYRDSDVFTIKATKNPVILLRSFDKVKIRIGQTKEIDLSGYFQDEAGDEISYSLGASHKFVDAEIHGTMLSISGKNEGETSVVVYVDNGAAEINTYTIEIECVALSQELKFVFMPILLLIILMLCFIVVKKSKERVEGVFKINIDVGETDANGVVLLQNFDILNTIPANSMGKKGFTLEKFLKIVQGYYMAIEFDQEKKDSFVHYVADILPEAKKVRINGSRKSFEIKIKNGSNIVSFFQRGTLSDKKLLTISIGNTVLGINSVMEQGFGIRFICDQDRYVQINIIYKRM